MLTLLRQLYEKLVPYENRLAFFKWRNPKYFEELLYQVNPSPKGDFSLKPFDEHKAIFVHITKTAGTSVAKSLFGYLPYHYTAEEYRVFFGKKNFNNYFKFAFVRNPWDRLYSSYRYLKSGGWNDEDKIWGEENLKEFDDFNDFVTNWVTAENIKKHIHFKPQHEFICDRYGNLIVNHIAYFETLQEDFGTIAKMLNIETQLAKHNSNPGTTYTSIYSEDAKEVVNNVYEKDIKLFGYNFQGIAERKLTL